MTSLRIVGAGRAGSALARALGSVGWVVDGPLGREVEPAGLAQGADLLVLAVPDAAIAPLAQAIAPDPATVVVHLSGALGLDVLAPHSRRAALHPLVSLPASPVLAADRLDGARFAVAGDARALEVVDALTGEAFAVADEDRVAYHAAAVMASNHLVALLGQVERVARTVGLPLDAFLDLVDGTVRNVSALGPAAALTGPVARGDWATVARHVAALDPAERPAYLALAERARRLVDPTASGPLPLPAEPEEAP